MPADTTLEASEQIVRAVQHEASHVIPQLEELTVQVAPGEAEQAPPQK